jgi:hypothetical protein
MTKFGFNMFSSIDLPYQPRVNEIEQNQAYATGLLG